MGLSANALVSLADVKSYLEIKADDFNSELEDMINRMSAEVETHCDRHFNSQTYTEYLDGDGSGSLILSQFPIISITSIYDDPDWKTTNYPESCLIDSSDYMYYADEGIVEYDGDLCFARGKKNIRVIYVAGYASIPYDVQHAVFEWIATVWKKKSEKRFGVSSVAIGDRNISYLNEGIPEAVRRRLAPYRNMGRHPRFNE